ncbi:alpha/beta fold hydrolase [Urbifossiella limnaea]|uniref:2-hydroxymuconate semialdehyde hydrolase n=1 Tax=Urbifossiella limnaea TaxID=2528023 RepID=A0A517XTB0_9BACT|nr:alpha/beta hydrolase [Urbifossiella limnaea]QDU20714.1 2-hydroxymuconate semialdehyde hydrolase [Urbifossiella limnaea]
MATVTADEFRTALARFRREARPGVVHTGRYRLGYRAWGSGPPVVFVHGMADVGRSFVMVMAGLADRFTTIEYDLPNGLTDGSALGGYTHRGYVTDLTALLDHLGFRRAAVVGSSFGSTIALAALATSPGRFSHGVLQGGFARRPLLRWQHRLAQLARFWPGYQGDWPAIHAFVMARVEAHLKANVPPEVWRFFLANHGRTPFRAAALRTLTIGATDLRPVLSGLRVPLLQLGGDRDPLVPKQYELEVTAGVPGAKRVEFAECGHYPQYTHPGPMARAIAALLGERLRASDIQDPAPPD